MGHAFDPELPTDPVSSRKPNRRWRLLPRTLGQLMSLVALSALAFSALAPGQGGPPVGPRARRPLAIRRLRTPPATARPAPTVDDRIVFLAPEGIDDRIVFRAPEGIDDGMVVAPERLSFRAGTRVPRVELPDVWEVPTPGVQGGPWPYAPVVPAPGAAPRR